jgi:hypothetical protein
MALRQNHPNWNGLAYQLRAGTGNTIAKQSGDTA